MTRKLSNGTHIKRDLYKSEKRPIRRCIIGKGTFSFLPVALCDDSKLSKELSDCTKVDSEVERLLRCWAVFNFCSTKTQEMTRFPITNLFFLMPSALTQKQSKKFTDYSEGERFLRSWLKINTFSEVEQKLSNGTYDKTILPCEKALCKCTRHFANALAPICYWRRCLFGKIDAELIWYWKECLFLLIQEVSFLVSFLLGTRSVFWIGNKTYPIGNKTYLIWNKTYPIGNKTYLIGNKTYPIWNKTYLIGNRTYPIGNKTYLIGNRTYQFRTRDGSSIGKKRVWNWKIASFVLEKVWSVLLSRRKRLLDLLWGGHD